MLKISFYFSEYLKSGRCAERTFVFVADEKTRSVTESVNRYRKGARNNSLHDVNSEPNITVIKSTRMR